MKAMLVVFLLWTSAVLGIGVVATALRMRGTIDKYDAATRVLSLKTADGTLQLSVAAAVRIRQDRHDIEPAALQRLSGYRAAVRYSESGGTKTAESIHVFDNK